MTDPVYTPASEGVLYGLRTFQVTLDGALVPISRMDGSWVGGRCTARCAAGYGHRAPHGGCSCGVSWYRDLAVLRRQYAAAAHLVAVVELSGQTKEDKHGYHSESGRIVALWLHGDALPRAVCTILLARLPAEVDVHTSLAQMVDHYPGLTGTEAASWTTAFNVPHRPPPPSISPLLDKLFPSIGRRRRAEYAEVAAMMSYLSLIPATLGEPDDIYYNTDNYAG